MADTKVRRSGWDKLCRCIYRHEWLAFVEWEGRLYRPRETEWDCCEDLSSLAPDIKRLGCEGYDECQLPPKPVQYSDRFPKYIFHNRDRSKQLALLTALIKQSGCSSITFINACGEANDDHRGSDHYEIQLDFHPQWTVQVDKDAHITLCRVIDALFRIRSHKRDRNYTMYYEASTLHKGTGLVVTVGFDYGS